MLTAAGTGASRGMVLGRGEVVPPAERERGARESVRGHGAEQHARELGVTEFHGVAAVGDHPRRARAASGGLAAGPLDTSTPAPITSSAPPICESVGTRWNSASSSRYVNTTPE